MVGERWTLLIVRELVIRGSARYSELQRGLPGIPTNLLAERVSRGAFDSLTPAHKGKAWRAIGWGWDLKGRRAPADVVLVDDTGRVLGIGLSGLPRDDVKHAVRQVTSRTAGWIASINRGAGQAVIAYGVTAQGPACELGRMAWPQS